MSRSAAFRLLLIVLLFPTIGWKVFADSKPAFSSKDVIVRFLKQQRFNVEVTTQMIFTDLPLIYASKGRCRLLVVEAAPDGSNRQAIRELARAMDQLFIVEHGKIEKAQSTWQDVTQSWWSGLLYKLGLVPYGLPLIAVASTADCNAERLAWSELDDIKGLKKAWP